MIFLVGDNTTETNCVPFVSDYSDCSDENMCGGCTRCRCTNEGKWSCQEVFECDDEYGEDGDQSNTISQAINVLYSEVKERKRKEMKKVRPHVPPPPKTEFDSLIVSDEFPYEENFEKYVERNERIKRSIDPSSKNNLENGTIKFHNTVDEINEDTLRNSNVSGTIEAHKVNGNLLSARRKNVGFDKTELSSLHIAYNQPQDYEHHIADNKIDSPPHNNDKTISLSAKEQTPKTIASYSESAKNKDVSKVVVNELAKGKEVIGDKDAIPISNITFTPENDTLTAMAFIAGNLLNKLWNMDKDSRESFETDSLKHQKINDLLELFKEPLSVRQEIFLKNALEKLSNSLNEKKHIRNLTICETLDPDGIENKSNKNTNDTYEDCNKKSVKNHSNIPTSDNSQDIHSDVAQKLTDVLNLIKKFENTQKSLHSLREKGHSGSKQSSDENTSDVSDKFNLFGKVLEKITKLLLPYKHSNKMIKKIRNFNQVKAELKPRVSEDKLGSLSLSAKDKIILDYINHIKNNPQCLLSKMLVESDVSKIDLDRLKGYVFESITKMFNEKSLVDLGKLTATDKSTIQTTTTSTQPTTISTKMYQPLEKSNGQEPLRLASAKERLKSHLKSIIKDLAELQNKRGNGEKEINITDILPCLSHLISNDNKNKESIETLSNNKKEDAPIDNIKKLIDALQLEFSSKSFSRRSEPEERSTSAKVWERIITNMDIKRQKTRRFESGKSKSLSDLKKMIESNERLSSTYKNYALLSVIPAYKRRMLLKTLQADIARHSNVLATIENSFDNLKQASPEDFKEIVEYIDNAATNIKLSNNVLRSLNKTNKSDMKPLAKYSLNSKPKGKEPLIANDDFKQPIHRNENIKLSREQIMNQLMLNRIQVYLKIKEDEGNIDNDISYNIGKRALDSLRSGNISLARDLYKILVENKSLGNIPQTRRTRTMRKPKDIIKDNTKSAILYAMKEPLFKIGGIPGKADDVIFT